MSEYLVAVNQRIRVCYCVQCSVILDVARMWRLLMLLRLSFRASVLLIPLRHKQGWMSFNIFIPSPTVEKFWVALRGLLAGNFLTPRVGPLGSDSQSSWTVFTVSIGSFDKEMTLCFFSSIAVFVSRLANVAISAIWTLKDTNFYHGPLAAGSVSNYFAARAHDDFAVMSLRGRSGQTCPTTL